jgi:hypothetical protein
MIFEPYLSFAQSLLKAWQKGPPRIRHILTASVVLSLFAIGFAALAELSIIDKEVANWVSGVLFAAAALFALGVAAYQSLADQQIREEKIESVEQKVREHPERPQLAWDLARTKLESYLDRNLSQVRSIYWLTLLVMLCGFGLVMYGLYQVSKNPEQLPVSIVASASGVLISFIGGSFLLIYRSILAQSKEYVTVLERINAVGMAVQVISSIPDAGAELKSATTAELAKQLLGLYASVPSKKLRSPKKKNAKQEDSES